MIDGEIYIRKPQTSVAAGASTSASSSSEYRPGIDTAHVLLMGKCVSCAWQLWSIIGKINLMLLSKPLPRELIVVIRLDLFFVAIFLKLHSNRKTLLGILKIGKTESVTTASFLRLPLTESCTQFSFLSLFGGKLLMTSLSVTCSQALM